MKHSRWNRGVTVLSSLGFLALLQVAQAAAVDPAISAAASYRLPLTFEVNEGQTDDRVDFLAHGPGYNIFLTATEAVFALPQASAASGRRAKGAQRPAVRMQLVGSDADPRVQGVDALPGKVNYFRGRDAAGWQRRVSTYRRVMYSAVYPGVDLVYYGQQQQLEYDFIVAPGADPAAIELGFAGVEQTTVDAQGDLVLTTAGGPPLRFRTPVIYQIDGGHRHVVEGGYVHRGQHQIGFRVGAYDRTRPLIIDPVLSYSTYLGGSGLDEGNAIAVDATGAVYVTGTTTSTDFPTLNAVQTAHNGGYQDIFVAKLTPDGAALVYATYLGGNASDVAGDIAVDSAGAAYVSALTHSSNFPTVHPLQAEKAGESDIVVVKLSADGSQLIYSTYLGGKSHDYSAAIAVDLAGAAYVAGTTESFDFPLVNCLQQHPSGAIQNAFVAKISTDGTALLYSTYLGGTEGDSATDIAVDSFGAAYVVGSTESADFPSVHPLAAFGGAADAFITKLAPDGSRLTYSSPLGGKGYERSNAIATDVTGAAYVIGWTESTDFPTMNALQPHHSADRIDAFVVKIAPEGGAMIYGTYLGGSGVDFGYGIAVDTAGAAHLVGYTESADFPTVNALQPALNGPSDAFVSKLSADGAALVHSTYLGGSKQEGFNSRMGIAVEPTGTTYVTGATRSHDFPTVNALQPEISAPECRAGDTDAFVVKITEDGFASPAAAAGATGPPMDETITTRSAPTAGGGAMDGLLTGVLALFAILSSRRRIFMMRQRPVRRVRGSPSSMRRLHVMGLFDPPST